MADQRQNFLAVQLEKLSAIEAVQPIRMPFSSGSIYSMSCSPLEGSLLPFASMRKEHLEKLTVLIGDYRPKKSACGSFPFWCWTIIQTILRYEMRGDKQCLL